MAFAYFDTTHAIEVHDEIINQSGGVLGILNISLLESVIEHVQNDLYYPDLEHKLTHLFYSINKNHSFQDGNKRASIALSAYFLEINNCSFRVERFIEEMENIAVDVADNWIDKDLLFEIITSIIYEDDYTEELKLKIIYAKGFNIAD
ncbi:MAG: type II toxin-antitoxin system death-on-curing family toxin [Saprospiraceae bacterium]|jgi:death-on-curing protein|nr:type II toxin-antitoxin system death-on-curing family toxin [Candidatus Parvibacillus calidus]MBX2938152.1 type II toxin-antitoxin system death-on-curing family toxin [Saprospiraceae bacterium]HNB13148.1 type II toxin-antitoxin system death-on-curing family toxin [Bacteroidia bacterium]MCB0591581.1 type II toxin-antitoxin system death-on-curing family toxin [Saprospiraceae bacterium]MCO5281875.1 type II toxin-antitoxin system death-on-curing family toxin [Saprospiraceae bacterium]